MTVKKRIPSDTRMEQITFLNNRKIDSELYAYLQWLSIPVKNEEGENETRVYKKRLPKQDEICEIIRVKSPKTYRAKRDALLKEEYLIDCGEYYLLPNQEKYGLLIPLETLQFFKNVFQEDILKIYVYLGEMNKYKPEGYDFTLKELATHTGIKSLTHQRDYDRLNDILLALKNNGLIDFSEGYKDSRPYKRLFYFSYYVSGKEVKYHF